MAAFFLVAIPVIVLVAVWAAVTMVRILFPERPLPFEAAARRQRATLEGRAVSVRLRDILEDQAHRQAATASGTGQPEGSEAPHPLVADLWAQRN